MMNLEEYKNRALQNESTFTFIQGEVGGPGNSIYLLIKTSFDKKIGLWKASCGKHSALDENKIKAVLEVIEQYLLT
jgi:hypothetical protein